MAGIEDALLSLLGGRQGLSPLASQPPIDAAQDFGVNGPQQPQEPMRPEDLIVSPDPSQPHPANQRMEGIRRMLTDFTFSLGSGLTAASQNPRGRAQRTMAGQGAILQVPKKLQDQIDAKKVAEEQRKQMAATAMSNILNQQSEIQNRARTLAETTRLRQIQEKTAADNAANIAADNAREDAAANNPKIENYAPGSLIITRDSKGNEISRETVPVKDTASNVSLTPDKVMVDGVGSEVLRDAKGNYIDVNTKQPVTGRITPYITPPSPRQKGEIAPTAEAGLIQNLNKQWDAASKDVQLLYRANTIMDSGMKAARAGDMNAGSQAVLVTFQKFLDPTSVVRESEYARSGAGQSMANQVRGYVDKLEQGGAGMTLPELEKFAKIAQEISNNLNKEGASLLSAEKKRIKLVADRYDIPIETVIPDYNYANPGGTTPPPKASTAVPSRTGMTVMNDPKGVPHYVKDSEVPNAPPGWTKAK
jgi:hypothetical protein